MTSVDSIFLIFCVDVHMGLDPLPPSTCVQMSLTPLRVDVINGWPLMLQMSNEHSRSAYYRTYQRCFDSFILTNSLYFKSVLYPIPVPLLHHHTSAMITDCNRSTTLSPRLDLPGF